MLPKIHPSKTSTASSQSTKSSQESTTASTVSMSSLSSTDHGYRVVGGKQRKCQPPPPWKVSYAHPKPPWMNDYWTNNNDL